MQSRSSLISGADLMRTLFIRTASAGIQFNQERKGTVLTGGLQGTRVLVRDSPRHPGRVVALAVGIVSAAFGRLLGVDWRAWDPIFVAAALSQVIRRH